MMDERRLILHASKAMLRAEEYGGIDPTTISLDIIGGDLLLLRVEQPGQGTAFADMCSGLLEPAAGLVQFLGKEWRGLAPDASNALRGRIGRVFNPGIWINQLNLLDNILLQQFHHTRYPAEHRLREASRLANRFGLPGIPIGRPEEFTPRDLQRAAWVRAFLGRPALILLEEPTRGLKHARKSRLIHAIREARDNGAAVVWITVDRTLWRDETIPATRRCRWIGRQLIEVSQK